VKLSDVALPEDHKQLLLNTFLSFDQFQKVGVAPFLPSCTQSQLTFTVLMIF